jgi:hypothetical protein
MQSNQGIRLDDDQGLPPFKERREQAHGEANRIGRSPWSFFRSRYKVSCFRRNRFSAASALRERSPVLNIVNRSNDTRREVHKNFASWGSFSMADKSYMLKSQFSCQTEYLRSTGIELVGYRRDRLYSFAFCRISIAASRVASMLKFTKSKFLFGGTHGVNTFLADL